MYCRQKVGCSFSRFLPTTVGVEYTTSPSRHVSVDDPLVAYVRERLAGIVHPETVVLFDPRHG